MAAPLPESTIPAAELLAARLAALSRLQAAEAEVNARVEADPEATRPADMFSQPALKRFLEQQAKDAVTALSEATIGSELSILRCEDLGRQQRALRQPAGQDYLGAIELCRRDISRLTAEVAIEGWDRNFAKKADTATVHVCKSLLSLRDAIQKYANVLDEARSKSSLPPGTPAFPRLKAGIDVARLFNMLKNVKGVEDLL